MAKRYIEGRQGGFDPVTGTVRDKHGVQVQAPLARLGFRLTHSRQEVEYRQKQWRLHDPEISLKDYDSEDVVQAASIHPFKTTSETGEKTIEALLVARQDFGVKVVPDQSLRRLLEINNQQRELEVGLDGFEDFKRHEDLSRFLPKDTRSR